MARYFNPAALATYQEGRASERILVRFDLADATYGFWTGTGPLPYGGLDYIGTGRLLSMDEPTFGTDGGQPLVLHLSAMPEEGLSMDLLATIEEHVYHQRPGRVSLVTLDPDTGALLGVTPFMSGYIDILTHEETVGGAGEIVCNLESRSRDLTRTGYRTRADADQRLIKADDGFFRYAATAGDQTISWGALPGKAT